MTVVIGIAPHKAPHTAAAVGADLAEAATIRVRASRSMTEELLRWAERWPERRWAPAGWAVCWPSGSSPPASTSQTCPRPSRARVRALDTGHGHKTDRADARSVAVVADRRPDLPPVAPDDHHRVLRLLADRRDELTRERRRTINRLHRHLRDLIPGGAPTHLSADTAAGLLTKVRPRDSVEAERKQRPPELHPRRSLLSPKGMSRIDLRCTGSGLSLMKETSDGQGIE